MDTFSRKETIPKFDPMNPCVFLGLAALEFRQNALFMGFPVRKVPCRIREAIFIQITVDFSKFHSSRSLSHYKNSSSRVLLIDGFTLFS